jgi:2-succinyl-6-hydroxy-2,4-cyclohexadiene-1-carboxylate synthase
VRTVFVPGFTQTASAWNYVLERELGGADTIVVDRVDSRTTFEACAQGIGATAGTGVYVGYSMGGRLCLRLALDRPDLVRALVLVSASPGLRTEAERAERRAHDEALAREIERDGVDAFVSRWLAQPMFASVPPERAGVDDRRRLRPEYLIGCLRVLGTGAMQPCWDRLRELDMPVLLVSGTADAKFTAIAKEMRDAIGRNAEHVELEGGHALLLEQPEALHDVLVAFIEAHG